MSISVKDKTLSYWSDIREVNMQPAVLFFILRVHIYKGHSFTYPTKITIKGCDNELNNVSNPYAIAEADMPYKKTDNCQCSGAYSTIATNNPYTDHHTCANHCLASSGCKTFITTKIPS